MGLHGALGDVEAPRDLGVSESGHRQAEYLALTVRQRWALDGVSHLSRHGDLAPGGRSRDGPEHAVQVALENHPIRTHRKQQAYVESLRA